MEEINLTTRGEYGLKAGGLLNSLQTFCILFGLSLSNVLFTKAEEVSRVLQAKDTCLQDALKPICLLKCFYQSQRNESAFVQFYAVLSKQLNNFKLVFQSFLGTEKLHLGWKRKAIHISILLLKNFIGFNTLKH